MATKTGKYAQPQTNEVTLTATIKITTVIKLPTNDETKAQKAIEAEKKRITKTLAKLGADNCSVADEKVFINLAE